MQLKDSIADTVIYVGGKLLNEPLTYVNGATVAVSVSPLQENIKLIFYAFSIIATVLVSVKYIMEIRKLKQENDDYERDRK